jgi:hypothetical protein
MQSALESAMPLEHTLAVKILVHNVSHSVPEDVFVRCANMLCLGTTNLNMPHVTLSSPLQIMNFPLSQVFPDPSKRPTSSTSPFLQLNASESTLKLKCVTRHVRSDWDNVCLCRHPLGSIAFARLPLSLDDIETIRKCFNSAIRSEVEDMDIQCCRLIFISAPGDTESQELENAISNSCSAFISHNDTDDVVFQKLSVQAVYVAAAVFKRLEAMARETESSPDLISSSLDSMTGSEEVSKLKKRKVGRMRKRLADICLLSGALKDARLHVTAAIEACKSNSDWLWLASAYEALSVLQSVNHESADAVSVSVGEAMTNYSHKDCRLFCCQSPLPPPLHSFVGFWPLTLVFDTSGTYAMRFVFHSHNIAPTSARRYLLSQSTTKSAVFSRNLNNILKMAQHLPAGDQISVYVPFFILKSTRIPISALFYIQYRNSASSYFSCAVISDRLKCSR